MIQQMRRRFSVIVLLGLFLITGGFVFAINYVNAAILRQQAQATLHMLLGSNGKRPALQAKKDKQPDDATPPEGLPPKSFPWQDAPGQPLDDQTFITNLSNFYTVRLDHDGQITEWFSDREELYTDAQIQEVVTLALEKQEVFGRIGSQYFLMAERPFGSVLVFLDARMEQENARKLLISSALVGLGAFFLMGLCAVLLVRRMTRPVQDAFDKQKQFVWDASHELKTPLAVISANAEALAGETGESRWLDYIRSEVQRTDLLVKNLLTLAQLDGGQAERAKSRFDLSHAVLSVALPFESAVFEAGKTLQIEVQEDIRYTGDEEMIKQLVVILLGNALKYSNDGGSIQISLEKKDEKRILRVHNTGEGLPKEEIPHVFARFYRADRSRNRENAGHGIGLAIAKTIVEAHKGKISAESEAGKWICFTVILP